MKSLPRLWLPLGALCFLFAGLLLVPRPRVFLVGDSTMADKPIIDNPERGWGQMIRHLFSPGTDIRNHARNGRSTKSFRAEGRWQNVVDSLQAGDYVLIQFGHNDAKVEDSTRFADANTTFRQNLRLFVADARAKSALPVLLTPVNRRWFDSTGVLRDIHGRYAEVVREVAQQDRVPLIDLEKTSRALFNRFGPEESKEFFLWVPPGLYRAQPDGKQDNTHFVPGGAFRIARLVADGIREQRLPLAGSLQTCSPDSLPGLGLTVALDNFYNNETRTSREGKHESFHYTWDDTTNSGYSLLGSIIVNLGYTITTFTSAPQSRLLKECAVYIIVDPDTPKECEKPQYMSQEAADTIEQWVRSGGMLLLLANDTGNCDLEHLNILSGRFGIRFNEDIHHRVPGNNYAMGASEDLPDHPIFAGVRKIYTKEVSSLTLTAPAQPLLAEGDIVLMASARVGKGLVVALGDPWVYNEYTDGRKLPEGFDNAVAADRLFRWFAKHVPGIAARQAKFFGD